MSGHRPFSDLLDTLPQERRRQIDLETSKAVAELERAANSKFVIYRTVDGMYRWRLVGADGNLLAETVQEFPDRDACFMSIDALRVTIPTIAVEEAA